MSNWRVWGHVWTLDDKTGEEIIVNSISGGGDTDLYEVVDWCKAISESDPRRCYWRAECPSTAVEGQEPEHPGTPGGAPV